MTDTPTGSNADEWALFLSEWGTAYCAVQIAEAIEARQAEARAKGIREAARHVASATGDVDLHNSILALLDQPAEIEGVTVQEAGMAIDPRVKDALDRLPHGEWEVWTSCSFRRISRVHGGDGDVLRGITQSSDGHPDLSWDENQCQAMCDLVNTLRALSGDRHE